MRLPLLSHIRNLFQKNRYLFCLGCIILLGSLLRLYHFDTRWGLSADSARDAAIALESIRRLELPLTASFSSAGPFVFAPTFYWLIMASYSFLPIGIISPWILTFIFGIGLILVFARLGLTLGNKRLSLLFAFVTAVSPQMIMNAAYLTQHTFVIICSAAAFLSFVVLTKTRRLIFSFLTGIFIGLAISFHYQALNLMVVSAFPLFIIGFPFRKRVLAVILLALGIIIPMTPLLYWDSQQQFANIRNILDFFLIGQYNLYIPMNWRIFGLQLLPGYWSSLIGGNIIAASLIMVPSFIYFVLFSANTIKKILLKQGKPASSVGLALTLLFGVFVVLLILNRYYKGERFEGYLLYLSPFVIVYSTYALNKLAKLSKIIAFIATTVLTVGGINAGVISAPQANNLYGLHSGAIAELQTKLPSTEYSLYDYEYSTIRFSQPLSLMLGEKKLINDKGHLIGVCDYCPGEYKTIVATEKYRIVDLDNETYKSNKDSWGNVNPASMYEDLIGWAKKHELTSSFSLDKYLLERFSFHK